MRIPKALINGAVSTFIDNTAVEILTLSLPPHCFLISGISQFELVCEEFEEEERVKLQKKVQKRQKKKQRQATKTKVEEVAPAVEETEEEPEEEPA